VGLFDPGTGTWCLKNSASAGKPDTQFQFAVFSSPTFVLGIQTSVPAEGQFPVVGDWDGNGITSIGVFDSPTGGWLLRNENSSGAVDGGLISFTGVGPSSLFLPVTGNWTGTRQTGIGFLDLSGDGSIHTLTGNVSGIFTGLGILVGDVVAGGVSGTMLK
jgi:hypothetical protein